MGPEYLYIGLVTYDRNKHEYGLVMLATIILDIAVM